MYLASYGIIDFYLTYLRGGVAVLRVEHGTGDQEVTGSTPAQALLHNNLRQVVSTLVPLSPSSICWYQCDNPEGNGRLWKR